MDRKRDGSTRVRQLHFQCVCHQRRRFLGIGVFVIERYLARGEERGAAGARAKTLPLPKPCWL